MELVKNFDSASQYFDLESKKTIKDKSIRKIIGWYKSDKYGFSALIVLNSQLYFLLNEKKYFIDNGCRTHIDESNQSNKNNTLKIYQGTELLCKIVYHLEHFLITSPFEYINEEDFDWGKLVTQIINNLQRKKQFIEYITEQSL